MQVMGSNPTPGTYLVVLPIIIKIEFDDDGYIIYVRDTNN
jgi:hypothetical protein